MTGERWRIEVKEDALLDVLGQVRERGARILSVQPIRQSLEDYFVETVAVPPGASWELDQ